MIWQWTGLAFFSLTLLPVGVALLTGHMPRRLRGRPAPMRTRGVTLLALYTAVPLNAIPRLAGAPEAITLAATAVAGLLAVAGCLWAAVATQRTRSIAR